MTLLELLTKLEETATVTSKLVDKIAANPNSEIDYAKLLELRGMIKKAKNAALSMAETGHCPKDQLQELVASVVRGQELALEMSSEEGNA